MNLHSLKNDINQIDDWYHKLIFIVDRNEQFHTRIPLLDDYVKVNVNRVLSESLISIPKQKYPMYIDELLEKVLKSKEDIYILQHNDILFDPVLQTNLVRLLENLSKTYKLIVEWPGKYVDGRLIYAEYGHPEYFVSGNFEGKVHIK